jgi:hypothetical protein
MVDSLQNKIPSRGSLAAESFMSKGNKRNHGQGSNGRKGGECLAQGVFVQRGKKQNRRNRQESNLTDLAEDRNFGEGQARVHSLQTEVA